MDVNELVVIKSVSSFLLHLSVWMEMDGKWIKVGCFFVALKRNGDDKGESS